VLNHVVSILVVGSNMQDFNNMLSSLGSYTILSVTIFDNLNNYFSFPFFLGCDSVIDKSTQDLWTTAADLTVNGYKAIFDANGVETLQQSYNNLSRGGRLVTYGKKIFIISDSVSFLENDKIIFFLILSKKKF